MIALAADDDFSALSCWDLARLAAVPLSTLGGKEKWAWALADREFLSILGEGGRVFCQHQPGVPDWLFQGLALRIRISLAPPAQSTLSYPEHSKYLWS